MVEAAQLAKTRTNVGGVQKNVYFYSCVHYRKCGQIGYVKTFREFRVWRYRPGSSTELSFKVRGGQQKKSELMLKFSSDGWKSEPIIGSLPLIYVLQTNSP